MSGSAALWVLVWVGSGAASADQRATVQQYADLRWLNLAEPSSVSAPSQPYPSQAAADVERALEQARVLSDSLQDELALVELERAKRTLADTPSLPQAAWLLAECLRIDATLKSRVEGGAAEARALWLRAAALDGGRSSGFGEFTEGAPRAPATRVALVAQPSLEVWVNGDLAPATRRQERVLRLTPGAHHVRVTRRGSQLWAGWVEVKQDTRRILLPIPAEPTCSRHEFERVKQRPDSAKSRAGVTCPRWLMARPAPGPTRRGAVQLRTCEGDACGGWIAWEPSFGQVFKPPAQPVSKTAWPSWASYVLAGAGVAALSGFVLWQAGAFDAPEPGRQGWVYRAPMGLTF